MLAVEPSFSILQTHFLYSTQAHQSGHEGLMTKDGILTLHINVIKI